MWYTYIHASKSFIQLKIMNESERKKERKEGRKEGRKQAAECFKQNLWAIIVGKWKTVVLGMI
jgi:hypothetical protein